MVKGADVASRAEGRRIRRRINYIGHIREQLQDLSGFDSLANELIQNAAAARPESAAARGASSWHIRPVVPGKIELPVLRLACACDGGSGRLDDRRTAGQGPGNSGGWRIRAWEAPY